MPELRARGDEQGTASPGRRAGDAVPPLVHEEGVGFFLAKARTVDPDFALDENVSEICRRLDDLPLALELAAARVKALTSAQILERLERSLPLLTGGPLDAPERQRTLRATIEWSFELLSEGERRLFARLAVFRGGCTLEAAEEVADGHLDTLQSLVDRSLVRFSSGRYWMLETIREYAGDRLAASPDSSEYARQHAEYFRDLAVAAEPELEAADQADWLDRLSEEHDNLRAALDWSLQAGHGEFGLRIAVALRRFWEVRGHYGEGWLYLSRLTALDQPDELLATALRGVVSMSLRLGELDAAQRAAEERLALCLALGDADEANRALLGLGLMAEVRGDLDRARELYEEVVEAGRKFPGNIGIPLNGLAVIAWRQGRYGDAEALLEKALTELGSGGDAMNIAWVSKNLAGVRLELDRRADALPPLRQALLSFQQLRSLRGFFEAFETAAWASTDASRAARLLGQADAIRDEVGDQQTHFPGDPYEHAAAIAIEALGQERFGAAHAEGRAMSLDDAIALAHEVIDAG